MKAVQDFYDELKRKANSESVMKNDTITDIEKTFFLSGWLAGYVRRDTEPEVLVTKLKVPKEDEN